MPHSMIEHAVQIPPLGLSGDLIVPDKATGIILFAHGSGSGRHSTRNRYVAGVLQDGGFGTLLLDLLTAAEEQVDLRTRHLRFDIGLLAGRLIEASEWLQRGPSTRGLLSGYFGASTGGGAALVAAAEQPSLIHAVVSRGGRPDLAGPALPKVKAPTLLIVGGDERHWFCAAVQDPAHADVSYGASRHGYHHGELDGCDRGCRRLFCRVHKKGAMARQIAL